MIARFRKSLAVLLLTVLAAAALTACGSNSSSGGIVVGYAGAIQSNPNNKAVEDGLRKQVEAEGGSLIVTDAQFDASKQLTDVRSLIAQKVDALVIWPIDPQGLQSAVHQAKDAGIPVLVQSTTEGGPYTSNFAEDDAGAAAAAADVIREKTGPGAGVAMIEGMPVVSVLADRNNAFAARAGEVGLEIVARQVNEKDTADGARPIVDAWKTGLGDEIKGIFAYNDPSALGAVSAVGGSFRPVVVGMNGSPEGVAAVKSGRLLATFDFHPVQQGLGLGYAAIRAAKGEKLPETVTIPATMITVENAGSWVSVEDELAADSQVAIVTENGGSVLKVTSKP
ncbi:sugar ABC transporter substrate-binding protein [Gordonia sp. NPDC003376]